MKKKPDESHVWTDAELEKLERRIAAEYKKAADELTDKINAYFESFKKRDAETKALIGTIVNGREYTERDYQQWRLAQIGRGKRFEALRDRIAERMTHANEVAAAYINDTTPGLYSLNRNYAAYTIEQQVGRDVGFDLWDEQTVKRLIVEQPDLMPYYPPKRAVKRGIDLAWGKRQITAQVTSGILQGESIKHLADRLQTNIPNMNRDSAIRAARTAVTGAQNAGRQDSYDAAVKMGIEMEKQWLATLDGRTRHDHAAADGQTVPENEPFTVGGYKLMFPGDMASGAPGHLLYNCRCTMIAKVKGVDMSGAKRRARNKETLENEVIENMTYSEWSKKTEKNIVEKVNQAIPVPIAKVESPQVRLEQPELSEVSKRRYEEGKRLAEKYPDYDYDSAFEAAIDEDYDIVAGMMEDIEEWGPKTQFLRGQFFKAGFYGDKPEYVSAVRYGEIPEGGRSKNWADGTLEQGVSVIGIVRKESDFEMKSMYDVTLGMQGIKKYEVRGWFLGRSGSDGEPLLITPKIEREL